MLTTKRDHRGAGPSALLRTRVLRRLLSPIRANRRDHLTHTREAGGIVEMLTPAYADTR
jgi:hypothetical protein